MRSFPIIFLLLVFSVAGQTKVDSLNSKIQSATDTSKIKLLLALHDELKFADFNNAAKVAEESFILSQKIGWQKGIALTGRNFGIALNLMGKYDSADLILDLAMANSLLIGDTSNLGYCQLTKGNVQYDQTNYDNALEHYYAALKTYSSINDYKGMSSSLIWIGIIYQFSRSDYKSAISTYKEALEYCNRSNSVLNKAYIYGNLGVIYTDREQFDSAIFYLSLGKNIKHQFNDTRGIGNGHNNIGNVYYEVGQLDSAYFHYHQALVIRRELNDQTGVASVSLNIGRVYLKQNQFQKAEKFLLESKSLAEQINYKECWQEACLSLSQFYEEKGQFEKSLTFYKEYKTVSDSIFNNQNAENLAELQTKYETEKKEQQLALQEVQLSEQQAQNQRNTILIWALAFVILLLAIIILLVRSRARRKQDLLQKEAEIRLQESLLSSSISSQENERKRFARDLHDGFGQMISVLNLNLSSLEKGASDKESIFENSSRVLDDMYKELKSICFNLMPETLIKNGVVDALREFAGRINLSDKVHVNVDAFGIEQRLPDLVEINLYRISQEWINNVIKYSDATTIQVQLTKDESEITLLIEDNGSGFEKTLLTEGKGNGWKNMQSRTNLLKAELELDTKPGQKGSTLILNVPIEIPVAEMV